MQQTRIKKLVFGGQGIGFSNGKTVFAWNALPGELVSVVPVKTKRDFIDGIAVHIHEPSEKRIQPREAHFLSCSPWQILEIQEENHWKSIIAAEQFEKMVGIELPSRDVIADDRAFHYRNKMEYSFWEEESGLELAFFDRGSRRRYGIEPCALAEDAINIVAKGLLMVLQKLSLTRHDIKSMIIRSARNGSVVANVFVKQREAAKRLASYGVLKDVSALSGFNAYYSRSQSPASTACEPLASEGDCALTETLFGKSVSYGALNFFQVNVPMFERALQAIATYIDGEEIVDYYSGVGAIAIALGDRVKSAVLVESDQESVRWAERNINVNHLDSFRVVSAPSERALNEICADRVIIMDPPRAGLHQKVIKQLLDVRPKRIVYLSCNIATQARDIALLLPAYALVFNELYNFFPRTPHIESLVVLER